MSERIITHWNMTPFLCRCPECDRNQHAIVVRYISAFDTMVRCKSCDHEWQDHRLTPGERRERDNARKRWKTANDPEFRARRSRQNREYRKAHREQYAEIQRRWRRNNPEAYRAECERNSARKRERYANDPEYRKSECERVAEYKRREIERLGAPTYYMHQRLKSRKRYAKKKAEKKEGAI